MGLISAAIPPVPYWQPKLSAPGEVVEGLDDIAQCILIILGTRQGSSALRPTFGSLVQDLMDAPMIQARPAIVREVTRALAQWEPRIKVRQVGLVEMTQGRLKVQILWSLVGGQTIYTSLVNLTSYPTTTSGNGWVETGWVEDGWISGGTV